MALFKSNRPEPQEPVTPDPAASAGKPTKKSGPTPTRKAAEAARRERLNPTLSPKQARARERAARSAKREQAYQALDNTPQRQLMRDVVDSRFNIGEIAMPLLMLVLATAFIPNSQSWMGWAVWFTWGYFALIFLDMVLVWRKFKKLALERGLPTKGMLFYGFNRTLSFRRWRQPAPRLKRGEPIA